MNKFPSLSTRLFTQYTVAENTTVVIPEFCTSSMREYVDQVVAFMLRYYYIEDDNSTDFGDSWKALRVMQRSPELQRLVSPMLRKIEGFDLYSVRHACEVMSLLVDTRFLRGDISLLVYHTLINAFQSLSSLSKGQAVYGFIECDYGHLLGVSPVEYASKSFLTNGVLAHVIGAKKGLSPNDVGLLAMHYALATESRLTHAGTEQRTTETGGHYITHLAIVLATGQTIWKINVNDIPLHYIAEQKAVLLAKHQSKLKGRL